MAQACIKNTKVHPFKETISDFLDPNPAVRQGCVQELLLQRKPILLEQMSLQHLEKTQKLTQTPTEQKKQRINLWNAIFYMADFYD
jgi:hypothetical protein